jgi:hypothetical protein
MKFGTSGLYKKFFLNSVLMNFYLSFTQSTSWAFKQCVF